MDLISILKAGGKPRDGTRPSLTPPGLDNVPGEARLIAVTAERADRASAPELLLMRLEALGIDPLAVKSAMPGEFRRLANVCRHCLYRPKCERDLVHEFATACTAAWRDYCPNAFTLDPPGWASGAEATRRGH